MFEALQPLPQDPILALMARYQSDPHPEKLDLGIGVYKDEAGQTPIMHAVRIAEQLRLLHERSKSYQAPAGSADFNRLMAELVFGAGHPVLAAARVVSAQTPGGCGALRMGAEFLSACSPRKRVWVSNPTWANHLPLLQGAGLSVQTYPYYNYSTHCVEFDAMLAALEQAESGDAVLLHACCHNPSGADLNNEQWHAVTDLILRKGLLPFVDMAYQGLGDGLDEDAYGLRYLACRVPEMLVAASCSKNFGLYRERTGALFLIGADPLQTEVAGSQLFSRIRSHYSMPPAHGAALVATILATPELLESWQLELATMRERIGGLRQQLVAAIEAAGVTQDFSFIRQQKGMFSFLGITPAQVEQLRSRYSIYLVSSGRMNVAGLSESSMDYFVTALAEVLRTDA